MKKVFIRAALTVALGAGVGLMVTACNGGSSNASSGVTLAEFNALKAQVQSLQTTVKSLQTTVASVKNVASLKLAVSGDASTATANSITYAASSTTSTCAWTVSGHPANSNPLTSGVLAVSTCDGYYVDVSEAAATGSGYVQPLTRAPGGYTQVFYPSSDCSGTGIVQGAPVGAAAAGFVFTLNPNSTNGTGMDNGDYTNPAYYWYVPAGTTYSQVQAGSQWQPGRVGCETISPALPEQGFAFMQNDASVTGVASAPRPGPVLPASP